MVDLSDALKANASIVFAAWIFMGFLQQRSDNATERYRQAVEAYRSQDNPADIAGRLKDQIFKYRFRCRVMGWATLTGVLAAILLIASLIFGVLDVIIPKSPLIGWGGIGTAVVGFFLVIVAAGLVMIEGMVANRQLDTELGDLPDLAGE